MAWFGRGGRGTWERAALAHALVLKQEVAAARVETRDEKDA
jgi:hypothetical protein